MPTLLQKRRYVLAVAAGAIYGIAVRLAILLKGRFAGRAETAAWVMSIGFIVGVPIAIAWIGEATLEQDGESHWGRWLIFPWLPMFVAEAVLLLFVVEGFICIVMAIPITMIAGSIGGVIAGLFYRNRKRNKTVSLACAAVLPLLFAGIESTLQPPTRTETADTSIVIHADETTVWNNIKTVPAIRPNEVKPSWSHRIGFPLPIAATLDREGVGGVRNASFQGNLVFIETVNDWQPNHQLGFTIKADTANIPPTTLDEHVTIGGRYFDVLDGQYRLEPIANGNIRLHLVSHQRLSTDFNVYAALWTTAIMRDLQNSILDVIKHRCESAPPTT